MLIIHMLQNVNYWVFYLFVSGTNKYVFLKKTLHIFIFNIWIKKNRHFQFLSFITGNKLNTFISVKRPQMLHLFQWCGIKLFYFSRSDARCSFLSLAAPSGTQAQSEHQAATKPSLRVERCWWIQEPTGGLSCPLTTSHPGSTDLMLN